MIVRLKEGEAQLLEIVGARLGTGARPALTLAIAWLAQAAAEAKIENVSNVERVGVVMLTQTECALLDAIAAQLGTNDRRAALATTIDAAGLRLRGGDRSSN